jgi:hypothetical protein
MTYELPLDREWRNGRFVLTPKAFADECRKIVSTLDDHDAHRALDILTNRLLNSLGYGEGVEIFEAAVRKWHSSNAPYPFPGKPNWKCLMGHHDWRDTDETGWGLQDTCARCGRVRHGSNPCP